MDAIINLINDIVDMESIMPWIIVFSAVVIDMVTGFAQAAKKHNIISSKMREGLWHQSGFLGLLALAYGLEYATNYIDLGVTIPAVTAVTAWIVLIETVSIIENLGQLNPAILASPISGFFQSTKDTLGQNTEDAK